MLKLSVLIAVCVLALSGASAQMAQPAAAVEAPTGFVLNPVVQISNVAVPANVLDVEEQPLSEDDDEAEQFDLLEEDEDDEDEEEADLVESLIEDDGAELDDEAELELDDEEMTDEELDLQEEMDDVDADINDALDDADDEVAGDVDVDDEVDGDDDEDDDEDDEEDDEEGQVVALVVAEEDETDDEVSREFDETGKRSRNRRRRRRKARRERRRARKLGRKTRRAARRKYRYKKKTLRRRYRAQKKERRRNRRAARRKRRHDKKDARLERKIARKQRRSNRKGKRRDRRAQRRRKRRCRRLRRMGGSNNCSLPPVVPKPSAFSDKSWKGKVAFPRTTPYLESMSCKALNNLKRKFMKRRCRGSHFDRFFGRSRLMRGSRKLLADDVELVKLVVDMPDAEGRRDLSDAVLYGRVGVFAEVEGGVAASAELLWFLDGKLVRTNGVNESPKALATVRSGFNTFELADGVHTLQVMIGDEAASTEVSFTVINTDVANADDEEEENSVRSMDVSWFGKKKKKKKKRRAREAAARLAALNARNLRAAAARRAQIAASARQQALLVARQAKIAASLGISLNNNRPTNPAWFKKKPRHRSLSCGMKRRVQRSIFKKKCGRRLGFGGFSGSIKRARALAARKREMARKARALRCKRRNRMRYPNGQRKFINCKWKPNKGGRQPSKPVEDLKPVDNNKENYGKYGETQGAQANTVGLTNSMPASCPKGGDTSCRGDNACSASQICCSGQCYIAKDSEAFPIMYIAIIGGAAVLLIFAGIAACMWNKGGRSGGGSYQGGGDGVYQSNPGMAYM